MNRLNKILKELQRVGRNKGDKQGSGPGGKCICPDCGYVEEHKINKPCNEIKCPECGSMLTKKVKNNDR